MKKSRLNPISKAKHRREKRFVPQKILKELEERSGGQCECYVEMYEVHQRPMEPYQAIEQDSVNIRNEFTRCRRKAMRQPHHIQKRSQGGKHTMENLIKICFEHHNWIENHPRLATERGLNKPY